MHSTRIPAVLWLCALVATPAAADVTIKQKTSGKAAGAVLAGDVTQYITASRMRVDQTLGGLDTSTIVDLGTQQMIVLNHKQREAEVYDLAKLGAEMAKVPVSEPKITMTPTPKTRQIAGSTCKVYEMDVVVSLELGAEKMSLSFNGPACIVKDAPGQADYVAFYKTALEKGVFFGDPRTAKAQPGQARGMAALYRQITELGVPYSQEMNIKFEGGGPMSEMMAKMGGTTLATEVIEVATTPIPADTFQVPAAYKVVQR